jgi:hypothetical protein
MCILSCTDGQIGVWKNGEEKPVVRGKSGDDWKVKRAKAERASFVADIQEEAWDKARDIAKREGNTELRVQGEDHKFVSADTYNRKDAPCPPKDMEH